MSLVGGLLLLLTAALAAFALRYDMLRTWRTVAATGVTAGVVVAASGPGLSVFAGATVSAYGFMVLSRSPLLWAMRISDWDFVEAYRTMLKAIETLPPATETGAVAFRTQWDAVVARFGQAPVPDASWQRLRDETVAELNTRAEFMDRPATLTPDSLRASRQRWEGLQVTFAELIQSHMSFWLISPWEPPGGSNVARP